MDKTKDQILKDSERIGSDKYAGEFKYNMEREPTNV